MQTPLSAMPPPLPDNVETQNFASPGGTMHLSSSQICMIILPWTPRETQDFASLHGCRRQSSIEGMRSIHRIHGKVETQNLASPGGTMHLSSSYYIMRILPCTPRETQDFASLHGWLRQSSIEGMRSIHRIHDKVETQNLASPEGTLHLLSVSYSISASCNLAFPDEPLHLLSVSYSISASCNLASPDEPLHLSSSSYAIHITLFLQYCPTPTASCYAAWSTVRRKCWQSYSGHLQLNDI